jgi:hypothetical protein
MSNEIVRYQPAIPDQTEFQVLQVIAKNAAASGLYAGVGNEQKILMILLAARELGIGYMTALNGGLWNIQGKIELSARLMTAMIRRSGHSITATALTDQVCTLEGKRADNGDTFIATFTIQEAQRAGLVRTGGNWIKYPQDMLYARALSRLARRLFADVIGISYVEGEIRGTAYEVTPVDQTEDQIEELITLEEIDTYIDSFQEDKPYMIQYIKAIATLKKWSIPRTVFEMKKDPILVQKKFAIWKSKLDAF